MKRHLVLCGKWLAGTSGVTALAYFVATEAAGGRHPVWPYGLFGGLLAVGLALYFTCQEGEKQDTSAKHETAQAPAEAKHDDAAPAQYDESPTSAAEDQVWAGWNDQYYTQPEIPPEPQSPPPGDPLTDRWRHTADGFKASPLMNITSYAMPGFMGSYDGSPFIRVGICVACDPVESEVIDSSQIRTALANFLSRDPVARLTELMTYIDEGSTWVPQAGRGPLRVEAILRTREQPVASAMLHLPLQDLRSAGRADDMACLWLHVVPRDQDGDISAPVGLADWHRRLVLALSIAEAFVDLLSQDLGLNASDRPAARVGIMLQSQKPALADLVDVGNLPTLQGATPSNQFLGYAIADPAGKPNDDVARDFLRQLCDYDLQVDVTAKFLQSIGALSEPA